MIGTEWFNNPYRLNAVKACLNYLGYGTHVDTSGAHVIPVLPGDQLIDYAERLRTATTGKGALVGIWAPEQRRLTVLLLTIHSSTAGDNVCYTNPATFAGLAAFACPFTSVELPAGGQANVWNLTTFTPTAH